MKNYLYQHWADSTIFMALTSLVILLSFLSMTPWHLFWIWLQFPVYLAHQYEEHFYPGNFREFVNKVVFHSKTDSFPLTVEAVFWTNILVVWFLFPLAAVLAQNVSPFYGVLLPVFGLFNATTHIIGFIVKRRYNPGLFASVFLNYPSGIHAIYILAREGFITGGSLTYSLVVTVLVHAAVVQHILRRNRTKPLGV